MGGGDLPRVWAVVPALEDLTAGSLPTWVRALRLLWTPSDQIPQQPSFRCAISAASASICGLQGSSRHYPRRRKLRSVQEQCRN